MKLFNAIALGSLTSTFLFSGTLVAKSQGYFDTSTGSFRCTNGMPEFTGSRPSGYTNEQARDVCGCIKTSFVKTGWEMEVYEKAIKGDTSDWRYKGMLGRLRSAVSSCAEEYRL